MLKVYLKSKYIGISKNRGTPKSSILIGFSIINHPFWWFSPYFWFNTHMATGKTNMATGNFVNGLHQVLIPT